MLDSGALGPLLHHRFIKLNENSRLYTKLDKISIWISRSKVKNISSYNLKQQCNKTALNESQSLVYNYWKIDKNRKKKVAGKKKYAVNCFFYSLY